MECETQHLGPRLVGGVDVEVGRGPEHSLAELIDTFDLTPGTAPSTTVSIVRRSGSEVEVFVLCDSPVVVLDTSGIVHEIRDDRLAGVTKAIKRPTGKRDMSDPRWVNVVEEFESYRNHPDGFWVASAMAEAARYAVRRTFPASEVDTIVALTDGAAAGVDDYNVPATWREAIDIADSSPEELLKLVQEAEASDPDAARWPRTKCHDDKAIAVINIART